MLCPPRPEAFISFLAAAKIGALWLGLNPRYQLPELSHVIGDSQPKLLLSIDSLDGRSYAPDIEILTQQNPGIRATVMIERRGEHGSSFDDWTASFTDAPLGAPPGTSPRQRCSSTPRDPAVSPRACCCANAS